MSDYIYPTISNQTAINILKEKINKLQPYSFTRFGDGEIYILNKKSYPSFEHRACNEWGYQYPSEVKQFYNDAYIIIQRALKNSDLIGIMDPSCSIVNLNYSPTIWSIKKQVLNEWGIDLESKQICDHMLCRSEEFGSTDSMKHILNGKSVNIISPNTELLKQKNLCDKLNTDVTFTQHDKTINLNNRSEFIKSFKHIKSDVVLLGVGIQKDYGVILRDEYGKIAIDMGATLDAWSGIISRPWFNQGNLQDHLVIK